MTQTASFRLRRPLRVGWLAIPAALLACASAGEPLPAAPPGPTASEKASPPAPATAQAAQAAEPAGKAEGPAPAPDFAEYRRRTELATAAYTKKDHAAFLEHSLAASTAFPGSPKAIYNVACAYSVTGKKAEAIAALNRLADLRTYFDIAADTDFAAVKDTPEFQAARGRLEALKAPIAKSAIAFTLPDKDLIPEGIAHDPKSGAFFVSSVHRRLIVRIPPKGKAAHFVSEGQHGLYAVLGMAVDPTRGSLWACSTATPEMKGYKQEDKGKAALFELDIATGKLKQKITPPEPEKRHNFNDLAIDSKGELFVADPATSAIYRLPPGASQLEVFVQTEKLVSPGGIALSPDDKSLYIADYARGIARIDRASREVTFLTPPADATLAGIDGLRMHNGELIGIQNGVSPHRVVRISMTPDGAAARAVTILEMGHPAYNEPTLGVVLGRDFFYIANSQWGSFDKGGVIWPLDRLKEPAILRMPLDR